MVRFGKRGNFASPDGLTPVQFSGKMQVLKIVAEDPNMRKETGNVRIEYSWQS